MRNGRKCECGTDVQEGGTVDILWGGRGMGKEGENQKSRTTRIRKEILLQTALNKHKRHGEKALRQKGGSPIAAKGSPVRRKKRKAVNVHEQLMSDEVKGKN